MNETAERDGDHIETIVKQVIVEALKLQIGPEEISDEELLFGGGLGLDSVATLEVVVALESRFGITVPDDDLRVELFDSVKSLADYVRNRLKDDIAEPVELGNR